MGAVIYPIERYIIMINKKTFTVLGATVALTVLLPLLNQSQANGQNFQENNSIRGIAGTWRTLVDPDANPGGDPPAFYAYLTFNSEGTLIQSGSDPLEGSRSGHGVWRRTARNELKAVFEKFIPFNPLTQQQGVFVFRVEEVINLTGAHTYEGVGQVSICNETGHDCQPLGTARTKSNRLRTD